MTEFAYPRRPPFFAMKFIRLMVKACVANEHGPQVFTLLVTIAATEDSAKYRKAVTFYDGQLQPVVGAFCQDTLARVRKRAVDAGWLAYRPGRKGVPGAYFVTVPPTAEGFTDAPVDEQPEELVADSSAHSSARVRTNAGGIRGRMPGESADECRAQAGGISGPLIPVPSPLPKDTDPPAAATAAKAKKAAKPKADDEAFARFWAAYPKKVEKQKAHDAFRQLNPPPDLLDEILAAVDRMKRSDDWRKEGGRFILYPERFLKRRRWEDETAPPPRPSTSGYDLVPGQAYTPATAPPMFPPAPAGTPAHPKGAP